MSFKKGDVVRLKSGGPDMTVTFADEVVFSHGKNALIVACTWFSGKTLETGKFAPELLVLAGDRGHDSTHGLRLSAGAKKILRHFRDKQIPQLAYEYPAKLAELFPGDPEACETAQAELASLGLIALGPQMPAHLPLDNRIVAAAITLDGERYIKKNSLD